MDNVDSPSLVYALILLVLLVSGLFARRLPLKQYAKMISAWVGIFAVAFVVISFRPEMKMMWDRVTGELTGAPRQTTSSEAIELVRQDDGHFWLRARVNGTETDFMIDSGATTTAINQDQAIAAKIELDPVERSVELDTANGKITARTGTIATMQIGEYQIDDLDVVVSESFGDTNVVGMNFLDSFGSWNVSGDVMRLKP